MGLRTNLIPYGMTPDEQRGYGPPLVIRRSASLCTLSQSIPSITLQCFLFVHKKNVYKIVQ